MVWKSFLCFFPRYGKKFSTVWKILAAGGGRGWVFSTVWKKVFHGVENVGGGFCGDGECGGGG